MEQFYYKNNQDKSIGPVSYYGLTVLSHNGSIDRKTLVRLENTEKWVEFGTIERHDKSHIQKSIFDWMWLYALVAFFLAYALLKLPTKELPPSFMKAVNSQHLAIQTSAAIDKSQLLARQNTQAKEALGDDILVKPLPGQPLTLVEHSTCVEGKLYIEGKMASGTLMVTMDYGIKNDFTVLKVVMENGKVIDLLSP
ncbi:MAG TPA: hypothetical protein VK970_01940 [Candidatus Methylacidiphilales bacterium]|nr:hypothetical protein [Candidatus Methylacidiphilales bacterium]